MRRSIAVPTAVSKSFAKKTLRRHAKKIKTKTTTAARLAASADVFNAVTVAACKEALRRPYPDLPDWLVNPSLEYNFDTTSIGIDLLPATSSDLWISRVSLQEKGKQVRTMASDPLDKPQFWRDHLTAAGARMLTTSSPAARKPC